MHGFYVAQLRRRMGVTAAREFARHRLRRAAYVGVPRSVVEQIMQQQAQPRPEFLRGIRNLGLRSEALRERLLRAQLEPVSTTVAA